MKNRNRVAKQFLVVINCLLCANLLSSCVFFGGGSGSSSASSCSIILSDYPHQYFSYGLGLYLVTAGSQLSCNGTANDIHMGGDLRVTTGSLSSNTYQDISGNPYMVLNSNNASPTYGDWAPPQTFQGLNSGSVFASVYGTCYSLASANYKLRYAVTFYYPGLSGQVTLGTYVSAGYSVECTTDNPTIGTYEPPSL